jgi:hypothetical protein
VGGGNNVECDAFDVTRSTLIPMDGKKVEREDRLDAHSSLFARGRLPPARPAAPDPPKSPQPKHRGSRILRRKRIVSPMA